MARRRKRRRNPASDFVPFLLGATALVVILYLAKNASGAKILPGP